MELKELVGLHVLTGVDMNTESVKSDYGDSHEDCQALNFILDGVTYTAIEDPSDGYRSNMKEIKKSKAKVKNIFKGQKVFAAMSIENDSDVLDLWDIKTGKIIVSVGTREVSDYYPGWVGTFTPENMSINANK